MVIIMVQKSRKQVLKEKASDGDNCSYHINALRSGVLSGLRDALLIILVNSMRSCRNELFLRSPAGPDTTILFTN